MPSSGERLLARARSLWSAGSEPGPLVVANDIPSAVTAEECRRLGKLACGKRVLEVGSYFGRSTIALASTASVVHSVDFHPPDDLELGPVTTLAAFLENIERYDLRHKVVAHVGYSQLVLPELRAASFDLVFLDAQHQRASVQEDLDAILPLVRSDGILIFHDYGVPGVEHNGRWDAFGVTEVVDAFVCQRGLTLEVVETLGVIRLA